MPCESIVMSAQSELRDEMNAIALEVSKTHYTRSTASTKPLLRSNLIQELRLFKYCLSAALSALDYATWQLGGCSIATPTGGLTASTLNWSSGIMHLSPVD
jgi:hypothetical protein